MDITDFKTVRFNVLGSGSRLKGEFHLEGPTTLAGEVEGVIHAPAGARLVLERGSRMKGDIHGDEVEIHGVFEGAVSCTGTLALRAGCEFTGKVKAGKLVVYPGASVDMESDAGE